MSTEISLTWIKVLMPQDKIRYLIVIAKKRFGIKGKENATALNRFYFFLKLFYQLKILINVVSRSP